MRQFRVEWKAFYFEMRRISRFDSAPAKNRDAFRFRRTCNGVQALLDIDDSGLLQRERVPFIPLRFGSQPLRRQ